MTTLVAKRHCVRFKDGVTLGDPPTPAQVRMLSACEQAAQLFGRDITITAGRDSHGPTDPHTLGRAVDIRTRDWSEGELVALYDALTDTLGPDFYVQVEVPAAPTSAALQGIAVVNVDATGSHIHAQVRRGLPTWPPEPSPADLSLRV